jgi:hypothetical protein
MVLTGFHPITAARACIPCDANAHQFQWSNMSKRSHQATWSGFISAAVILAGGLKLLPGGLGTLMPGGLGAPMPAEAAVQFKPSAKHSAPRQTTGGASRGGQIKFKPNSRNQAPRQTVGGASRGVKFQPASGRGSLRTSYGGASRGNLFTPKQGKGTPSRSDGGASRTNLYGSYSGIEEAVSMLAITPEDFFGTTLEARPTMMVYLPESSATEAVFTVKDEAKNLHYQMTLPVSGKSGVVAVQIPDSAPELKIDQNYQWYVALKVEGDLVPGTPFVDGWIKRIAPTPELAKQLEGQSEQKQADILATEGIWYDCSAKLAALRRGSTSESIVQDWKDLLGSVQLTDVAAAPLLASN